MFKKKNDLLNGPVLRELLLFTIPLFLSYLFQQLYNTVDMVIIGNHLGETSLAAIGASMAVFQLLLGFSFGFSGGFGIVVARTFGSGDEDSLKQSVAGSLMIGGVIVVIIMLIGVFLLKPLLILLKTPTEILQLTYDYIYIITMFAGVSFVYNLASGLLRSIGNSMIPLLFLVLSSILNVVLDILFVIGLDYGIKGAAIATVLAQSVAVVLLIGYIWKKEHELIPERKHFKVNKELFKDLFGQGSSMAMMISLVVIGTVIIQYSINQMGYIIIAGHTAARRLISLFMMPMSSIALSTTTFVSQNKGANNGRRIIKAVKYANILCITWSLVISLIVMFLAEEMMSLISGSNNPILIVNGSNYLRFNLPFFVIVGVLFVTRYSLQGLGEKIIPLVSSVIELVMKFVFVIVIIPIIGYTGVIISEPLIWVVMTIQLLYSYYRNPYIESIRGSLKENYNG